VQTKAEAQTSKRPTAEPFVPPNPRSIDELRQAARECRGCELYRDATQTVFGAGNPHARIVLVGETPGDQEDRQGVPFVGPAGRLLDKAMDEAGIDREATYVTNAVKHFRFGYKGKRRIHQTPDRIHIEACRPWLIAELALIKPELVVVLGAVAARSLLGPSFRVTRERGQVIERDGRKFVATVHPSAVLRADDREAAFAELVKDLRVAAEAL